MKIKSQNIGLGIVIVSILLVSLSPLFYLFLTSIKPPNLLMASPPRYVFKPDFTVYGEMIIHRGYFRYYGNSFLVASAATVLAIFIGAFASFAFVRYNFKRYCELQTRGKVG